MRLFLLTALAMLAFAANSVLNRMAVGAGSIDPVMFALVRLAAGAAMLSVLVLARQVRWGDVVWPGAAGRLAGVTGLLTYLFFFSMAYLSLDAGVGALFLFGSVQITMFAGALVAREPVPILRWIGAGLALLGLVMLATPGFGAGLGAASVLMALAGVGWGIYSLAGRRARDPLAATAANFVLALPIALGLAWLLPASGVVASHAGMALAILSGAVTSGLGYALWYALVPDLGAARAAVAQLTVPVIAASAGALMLGEAMSFQFMLATALVLSGVAMAALARG
ncbi:MAG: DMT family transporter [Paracoccaceae bacterium]|nr:DMT family transporter [Paracoccaceae bacterium]